MIATACSQTGDPTLAPHTIYHNGKVFTANAEHDIVEAVAVREGTITHLGSNGDVLALASDATELIDLEGYATLPGFSTTTSTLAWEVAA